MSNDFNLAPYALKSERSKGRLHSEHGVFDERSCFQRDRGRVVHSSAFRKLGYRTQVFMNYEGDYYRTRLTHSLEVAQITGVLCRRLRLNEDLGEVIALSHDLGHPPFGHAGEDALRCAAKQYVEFDHNVQTLRVLVDLEKRYAGFDGLNLTLDVLDGLAKHNGPLVGKARVCRGEVNELMAHYGRVLFLELDKFATAEAQIASFADDIAYTVHDLDDGLRAGFFSLAEAFEIPGAGRVLQRAVDACGASELGRMVHEALRCLTKHMVDLTAEHLMERITEYKIQSADDIINLGEPFVVFPPLVEECRRNVNTFLRERLYEHYRVRRVTRKYKSVIVKLFECFFEDVYTMPKDWQKLTIDIDDKQRALIICDYIAGMTDRFAIREYQRLFDVEHEISSF